MQSFARYILYIVVLYAHVCSSQVACPLLISTSPFELVVRSALSSDNAIRQAAEKELERRAQVVIGFFFCIVSDVDSMFQDPDQLLSALAQTLQHSQQEDIRHVCGILLKQVGKGKRGKERKREEGDEGKRALARSTEVRAENEKDTCGRLPVCAALCLSLMGIRHTSSLSSCVPACLSTARPVGSCLSRLSGAHSAARAALSPERNITSCAPCCVRHRFEAVRPHAAWQRVA